MKKKILIIILILILIIIICELYFTFSKKNVANMTKETESSAFEVYKTHYYTNVGAVSKQTTYQNPEWDLDVYQYTDIAIYLKRTEEYNIDNYISKLTLDNIQFSKTDIGSQEIYYLNPEKYGKNDNSFLSAENKITDHFEYNIVNYENEENDITYNIPIFFEDCSNPITLRYLNSDLVSNYKYPQTDKLKFNGSLLKTAGINLDNLKTKITATLNIITKSSENYSIPLEIDISIDERIYDDAISIIN